MNPALVDVAVLILFFNRPEPLSKVFEQVRKARPAEEQPCLNGHLRLHVEKAQKLSHRG